MSDEPTPPPPRLKPRLSINLNQAQPPLEPPSAPDAGAPPPEAPEGNAAADLLRLRLKPKAPPVGPAPAAPVPPPPTYLTPDPFASRPPAIPPPAAEPFSSMPLPVPPPSGAAPRVPSLRPATGVPETAYTPTAKETAQAVYKADKWLVALVAFIAVLAGGFYGVSYFKKSRAESASVTASTAPSAPAAVSKPVPVANPTSLPAKRLAQARDIVAARNQGELVQGVDRIMDEAAQPSAAASSSQAVRFPASSPAADVEPVPVEDEPAPPPSEAFREFVIRMRVSGVFQGEPPRALLNGKMYRLGDLVDPALAITLHKIVPDDKQLVFRGADGAIMTRRY